MLQKTMVVVEGVSRTLDPNFNMWKSAEPVVGGWIRKNLGPVGIVGDVKESGMALLHFMRQTPELTKRLERLSGELDNMAANGLRFDEATAAAIGKAEARHTRTGRVALIVIAVCMVILTVKLLF
jgi:ubiquinone biosynthesis protein